MAKVISILLMRNLIFKTENIIWQSSIRHCAVRIFGLDQKFGRPLISASIGASPTVTGGFDRAGIIDSKNHRVKRNAAISPYIAYNRPVVDGQGSNQTPPSKRLGRIIEFAMTDAHLSLLVFFLRLCVLLWLYLAPCLFPLAASFLSSMDLIWFPFTSVVVLFSVAVSSFASASLSSPSSLSSSLLLPLRIPSNL